MEINYMIFKKTDYKSWNNNYKIQLKTI